MIWCRTLSSSTRARRSPKLGRCADRGTCLGGEKQGVMCQARNRLVEGGPGLWFGWLHPSRRLSRNSALAVARAHLECDPYGEATFIYLFVICRQSSHHVQRGWHPCSTMGASKAALPLVRRPANWPLRSAHLELPHPLIHKSATPARRRTDQTSLGHGCHWLRFVVRECVRQQPAVAGLQGCLMRYGIVRIRSSEFLSTPSALSSWLFLSGAPAWKAPVHETRRSQGASLALRQTLPTIRFARLSHFCLSLATILCLHSRPSVHSWKQEAVNDRVMLGHLKNALLTV